MKYRTKLIKWLFIQFDTAYSAWYKNNKTWNTTKKELFNFPKGSLGRELAYFLLRNNFELKPKFERHDTYHVLTGYKTTVKDEIALQCLCLGNGKRNLFMYGAILLGITILPEHLKQYYQAFKLGQDSATFHHLDYEKILYIPLIDLQYIFFAKKQTKLLNISMN